MYEDPYHIPKLCLYTCASFLTPFTTVHADKSAE